MRMNNLPPYSVLMSVYSKEKPDYFQQAIMSMLSQTEPPSQFVIVCDGPLTSELEKVLSRFIEDDADNLFEIVRLEHNSGLGQALNAGLQKCSYRYVARMDSDDVSVSDRCERQLREMEAKGLQLISGSVIEFSGSIDNAISIREVPLESLQILEFAKKRNPFNHPGVMFDKEAVESVGGYQPFYLLEDYYLWIRMLISGCKARNLSTPVVYMRADEGMYVRRGGIKYVKSQLRLLRYMKSVGLITWYELLLMAVIRTISCIVPSWLRKQLYGVFVRTEARVS